MPAETVTCPGCAVVLKPSGEVAPGANIKCPRCGVVFAMPSTEVLERPHYRKPPSPRGALEYGEDAGDEDYDRPRRRSVRGRGGSSTGLVIGLSIGGGVLLLGVIALVIVLAVKGGGSAKEKAIVGVWQPLNQPGFTRAEFTADGKIHVTLMNRVLSGTYRFLDDKTIEIEEPTPFGQTVTTKGLVSITGDEMTITNSQIGTVVRYKRMR